MSGHIIRKMWFICSGTPAAAQGCIDGYDAADKRVKDLLKDHRPDEVQKFIKENIGSEAEQNAQPDSQ